MHWNEYINANRQGLNSFAKLEHELFSIVKYKIFIKHVSKNNIFHSWFFDIFRILEVWSTNTNIKFLIISGRYGNLCMLFNLNFKTYLNTLSICTLKLLKIENFQFVQISTPNMMILKVSDISDFGDQIQT